MTGSVEQIGRLLDTLTPGCGARHHGGDRRGRRRCRGLRGAVVDPVVTARPDAARRGDRNGGAAAPGRPGRGGGVLVEPARPAPARPCPVVAGAAASGVRVRLHPARGGGECVGARRCRGRVGRPRGHRGLARQPHHPHPGAPPHRSRRRDGWRGGIGEEVVAGGQLRLARGPALPLDTTAPGWIRSGRCWPRPARYGRGSGCGCRSWPARSAPPDSPAPPAATPACVAAGWSGRSRLRCGQ